MFIKEIILFGFKSYRELTKVSDLSNGLNVIVGRNGSGKSNIFAAIEFALTMDAKQLKPETKAMLLSQGRTPSALKPAFVEIVFDNTDRKLSVDEDIVVFRRVLGTKKDKFYVNKRELSNAKQFLDFAGFSNPYFIVKQGKIQDLAMATDAQRLKILYDAAGCGIFDAKITDCRKSLDEAESKQKDIKSMMDSLTSRKTSLEIEVADQKKFMKLDQTKRGVEFVLHERHLREIQKKLEELESQRMRCGVQQRPLRSELEKTLRNLQIFKRDLGDMESQKASLDELRDQLEKSKEELTGLIETKRQELNESINPPNKQPDGFSLESLEKDISAAEESIRNKENALIDLKKPMQQLGQKKVQLSIMINALTEKEAKLDSFNKADYQRYLKNQTKVLLQDAEEKEKAVSTSKKSLKQAKALLDTETNKLENLKTDLSGCIEQIKGVVKMIEEQQVQENALRTQLEANWRATGEIEQKYSQKHERVAMLNENFKKVCGASNYEGWIGVKKIIDDFEAAGVHTDLVEGYYGLVCENIRFDPALDIAAETAAGNKLVHHVVQNANLAQTILDEFNSRGYRGEVNFIPISGLKINNSQILSPEGLHNAKPMMSVLQVDKEELVPVAEFIFGNTLLCDSLQCATEMMRTFKSQCVTLDGDKVSRNGVITGGYIRRKPQKLELQRAKSSEEKELANLAAEKATLLNSSNRLKEELKCLKQKLERCAVQKMKLMNAKREVLNAIERADRVIANIKEDVKTGEKLVNDYEASLVGAKEKVSILKATDGTSHDKVEVLKTFRVTSEKLQKAERDYMEKQKEKSVLEAKLQHLKKMYHNNLESSCAIGEESSETRTACISNLIKSLKNELSEVNSKINCAKEEAKVLQNEISSKQKEVDQLLDKKVKLNEQLGKISTELESVTENCIRWSDKLKEHIAAREKLGSIPVNLESLEALGDKELHGKLKKANLKLKSIGSGINQKAAQQFEELVSDLVQFERRRGCCIEEGKELRVFLSDLETKRGETMLQNIRVLQEQFQSIFCSIVPGGNAELIVYGKDVSVDRDQNIDSDHLRRFAGQNMFEGVKVHVNFLGKDVRAMKTLSSLSGGQKSVVALCLILAIQTVDPVPFYLFDEVDQAMDAAYRDAVASVIGKMSERSQFICTTFRKEFVEVADKVYGVAFQNKCSCIQPISETQALDFIESEMSSSESGSSLMSRLLPTSSLP